MSYLVYLFHIFVISLTSQLDQLQSALTKAEASLKDRVGEHETSVNLLSNQLKEALAERDVAKQDLRKHEEAVQATANNQQEHLYAQIQVNKY